MDDSSHASGTDTVVDMEIIQLASESDVDANPEKSIILHWQVQGT